METKICNVCELPYPYEDFYCNRRTCKKCIIANNKKHYEKTYSKDVESIKCKKCMVIKSSQYFALSSRTGLFKEVCIPCRKPKEYLKIPEHMDRETYLRLDKWFKDQMAVLPIEHIHILKHIIANHNIF